MMEVNSKARMMSVEDLQRILTWKALLSMKEKEVRENLNKSIA